MKYKIGDKVKFNYDCYEYYGNVELVYEETVVLNGEIISVDKDTECYFIDAVNGINYKVKEKDIISSEKEEKLKECEDRLQEQKIKIADCALKMRNALWDDHQTNIKESSELYEKLRGELYDLMSEYDNLEDQYITLGGENNTY